jgi:hypothetical protein
MMEYMFDQRHGDVKRVSPSHTNIVPNLDPPGLILPQIFAVVSASNVENRVALGLRPLSLNFRIVAEQEKPGRDLR